MVLRESSLYWAILFAADLRGADLRGADLRHANLGLNRLGSATELQGANLADIRWERAVWTGAASVEVGNVST
jgi:uncharacterized protein YjbI with pentapeptide repeats